MWMFALNLVGFLQKNACEFQVQPLNDPQNGTEMLPHSVGMNSTHLLFDEYFNVDAAVNSGGSI